MPTLKWPSPNATPELASDEIHVWRASLPEGRPDLQLLESTLSQDERTRAARFILERDRNRFIAARGILRDLLGKYLQRTPQAIEFVYGPRGKPALAGDRSRPRISFNLSHSHGLAMIAIGREREVGIDVELIRPEVATEDIAKRYFSVNEVDELSKLPADVRTEAFFLCWTRKEAYIKAKGDGLHISLDSFDVSLSPGGAVTLSGVDDSRWRIESFVPILTADPKYVAAVAAEGKDWSMRHFCWKQLQAESNGQG